MMIMMLWLSFMLNGVDIVKFLRRIMSKSARIIFASGARRIVVLK